MKVMVLFLLLLSQAMSRIVRAYDLIAEEHGERLSRPFSFGYKVRDEHGNAQWHREQSDERNHRKGSYGYTDAHGLYRHVDYIADHLGFRAKIRSNEPGVDNYDPAHVHLEAEHPPRHHYAKQEEEEPYHPQRYSPEPYSNHYSPEEYKPHYSPDEYKPLYSPEQYKHHSNNFNY